VVNVWGKGIKDINITAFGAESFRFRHGLIPGSPLIIDKDPKTVPVGALSKPKWGLPAETRLRKV
jgi:hypothetical protein